MLILYFLRPITVNSESAAGAKMFMLNSATRENRAPESEKVAKLADRSRTRPAFGDGNPAIADRRWVRVIQAECLQL